MSNIQIGSLKDNYFYIDFTGKTDPKDSYSFTSLTTGSTRISVEGFSGDINMELRDKDGKVIKTLATNGTNAATLSVDNLGAADYILNVSPISRDTNYQVSLTPNGKVDPITGLKVDSGFFTPDQKGQVGFDFLHDGGGYKGEVAIFSVDGMENFTPGSKEFIKEAARRALTDSVLGHIVISESIEGANPQFRGSLGEGNYNNGEYKGVKNFAMTPGKAFAVMLVPNGKVQNVFNNPEISGDKSPLFSLSSSNPNSAWLYGEVADVTGDGKAFAMEDKNPGSDKDYNDIIFNLTGATGKAVLLKEVIDPAKDWTTSDQGKKVIDYVKSTLPVPEPLIETKPPVETPVVETKPPVETPPVATTPPIETTPPVETPPVVTTPPIETTPPVATTPPIETTPPVETPPVVTTPPIETTPPVATTPPVETKPPVETPLVVTTPPIETTPPVATTPPVETKPTVETPPVATTPPVETTPPVATTPLIETKPPVATTPPVETMLPVETPPVATTPPVEETESPVEPEPIAEPTIDPMPFIGVIDTGFAENNPDLDNSKVTLGRDRVDKDNNPYLSAGEGDQHGTFIRGLISAIQGNDRGIDGINDQSPVYLSRAIGSGEWDLALNDFVSEAKAQKKKNAIANLSLDLTQKNADGTITTRYEFTGRERAALENARQNGVLIVVAAGNDGGVMSVLGQSSQEFENIITIGSSDGFGRADYSSYGYGLDLLVPGGTIENPTLSIVGDDVGTMAGTSVAAAKATGMASVVWAANPGLNVTQVIDVLTGSAIDLKEPGWDEETGFGVLNFKGAIDLAKETKAQSYVPTAFLNPTTWGKEGLVTPWERAAYELKTGEFTSIIWSDNGVNLRNSPSLSDRSELNVGSKGETFTFDAWTYGEAVPDLTTDEPDALWYRINVNGQSYWVPSAYTNGYPPGNPPLLPPNNSDQLVDLNPPPSTNSDQLVDLNPPPFNDQNQSLPSSSININGYAIGGNFYPVFQNYQGTLGNPISAASNYNGVSYQLFENGSIVSSANGTFPLYGGIRQAFLNTGGLDGWLGAPKSGEIGLGDGNIIQYFEHGHIYLKGSKATPYKEGIGLPSVSVPSDQPISGKGVTIRTGAEGNFFPDIRSTIEEDYKASLPVPVSGKGVTLGGYRPREFDDHWWDLQTGANEVYFDKRDPKNDPYFHPDIQKIEPSTQVHEVYVQLSQTLFKNRVIGSKSGYAYDQNYFDEQTVDGKTGWIHSGIDISANTTDNIYSPVDGTVVHDIPNYHKSGRAICVQEKVDGKPVNRFWWYLHLASGQSKEGQPVTAKTTKIEATKTTEIEATEIGSPGIIAGMGPHLHLTVATTSDKDAAIDVNKDWYKSSPGVTQEQAAINAVTAITMSPLQAFWEAQNKVLR